MKTEDTETLGRQGAKSSKIKARYRQCSQRNFTKKMHIANTFTRWQHQFRPTAH